MPRVLNTNIYNFLQVSFANPHTKLFAISLKMRAKSREPNCVRQCVFHCVTLRFSVTHARINGFVVFRLAVHNSSFCLGCLAQHGPSSLAQYFLNKSISILLTSKLLWDQNSKTISSSYLIIDILQWEGIVKREERHSQLKYGRLQCKFRVNKTRKTLLSQHN